MDNAQKAIMIGVGLFITIIIIAAVMLITGMGQDMLNQGTQQLSQMSAQLQKQLTQDYDGTTMTGAQVLAAVKKYHGDANMAIMVENGKGPVDAGGIAGTVDSNTYVLSSWNKNYTGPAKLADFSDRQNESYCIVTTAKYEANLIKQNDLVVGLYFKKK